VYQIALGDPMKKDQMGKMTKRSTTKCSLENMKGREMVGGLGLDYRKI
jgi:hypothetical protein